MDKETLKSVAIAIGKVVGVCVLWKTVVAICNHFHK